MARGVCPECGGAPCALRPVCPGEPQPFASGGVVSPESVAELAAALRAAPCPNVYVSGQGAAVGSSRATSGTTSLRHPQPRGVMCRDCAPIGCDGSCDLPPFTD